VCVDRAAGPTSAVAWNLRFSCEAIAARSELVDVRVVSGSCPPSAAGVLYAATVHPDGRVDQRLRRELAAGRYAFSATAREQGGRSVASGCASVELPRGEPVALFLDDDGVCAARHDDTPDAPLDDDHLFGGCVGDCAGDGGVPVDAGARDAGAEPGCVGLLCDGGLDASSAGDADAASTPDDASVSTCDGSSCVDACQPVPSSSGVCTCGLHILPDDKSFRDAQGYGCEAWRGLDCYDVERLGYTQAEGEAVRANCSTTCGVCW
jgi:hypothetical protein